MQKQKTSECQKQWPKEKTHEYTNKRVSAEHQNRQKQWTRRQITNKTRFTDILFPRRMGNGQKRITSKFIRINERKTIENFLSVVSGDLRAVEIARSEIIKSRLCVCIESKKLPFT